MLEWCYEIKCNLIFISEEHSHTLGDLEFCRIIYILLFWSHVLLIDGLEVSTLFFLLKLQLFIERVSKRALFKKPDSTMSSPGPCISASFASTFSAVAAVERAGLPAGRSSCWGRPTSPFWQRMFPVFLVVCFFRGGLSFCWMLEWS